MDIAMSAPLQVQMSATQQQQHEQDKTPASNSQAASWTTALSPQLTPATNVARTTDSPVPSSSSIKVEKKSTPSDKVVKAPLGASSPCDTPVAERVGDDPIATTSSARKRTASMASLPDDEDLRARGSPTGSHATRVLNMTVLTPSQTTKEVGQSKLTSAIVPEDKDVEGKSEEDQRNVCSDVDELVSEDGKEGQVEDDMEEFDPTAEVGKFDSKTELVDMWDEFQKDMQPMLLEWAESSMENAFLTVHTALHLFHLLNLDVQKKLRDGVASIEAEEANQEDARQRIISFQKEMEKATASLNAFANFGLSMRQ